MEWLCSNNPSKKCNCRDVCNNMVKCKYCKKEATHYRKVDLDIKWIPLCDEDKCFIKFLIDINWIDLW